MDKEWLTTDEVAELFGVCRNTIVVWNRRGILRADRVLPSGQKFLYKREKVEAYLNSLLAERGM